MMVVGTQLKATSEEKAAKKQNNAQGRHRGVLKKMMTNQIGSVGIVVNRTTIIIEIGRNRGIRMFRREEDPSRHFSSVLGITIHRGRESRYWIGLILEKGRVIRSHMGIVGIHTGIEVGTGTGTGTAETEEEMTGATTEEPEIGIGIDAIKSRIEARNEMGIIRIPGAEKEEVVGREGTTVDSNLNVTTISLLACVSIRSL